MGERKEIPVVNVDIYSYAASPFRNVSSLVAQVKG
jgi:hypothetical protein